MWDTGSPNNISTHYKKCVVWLLKYLERVLSNTVNSILQIKEKYEIYLSNHAKILLAIGTCI